MPNIPLVNLKVGQRPTDIDWESYFNTIINYLNQGIPPEDIQKDGSGRVVINIAGDAQTLQGKTPEEIAAGDFPDMKRTLIDFLTGGQPLVLSGGVATKNAITANQLDITALVLVQKVSETGYIDRVELPDTSKTTTLANTTYHLDVVPGALDYHFDTEHPEGDYVNLYDVTTDGNANIDQIIDNRPLTARILDGFLGKILIPAENIDNFSQKAVTKLDGITGGEIDLVGGTNIQITTDVNAKTITISLTGKVASASQADDSIKLGGAKHTYSANEPAQKEVGLIWWQLT